ncbi:MAG: hypothetical protein ACI8RA_003030 [Chlamydiales bacterium]|jgi:hypothetical protein
MSLLPIAALGLNRLAAPYYRNSFHRPSENNRTLAHNHINRGRTVNSLQSFPSYISSMNRPSLSSRLIIPQMSVRPIVGTSPVTSPLPLPPSLRVNLLVGPTILVHPTLMTVNTAATSPTSDSSPLNIPPIPEMPLVASSPTTSPLALHHSSRVIGRAILGYPPLMLLNATAPSVVEKVEELDEGVNSSRVFEPIQEEEGVREDVRSIIPPRLEEQEDAPSSVAPEVDEEDSTASEMSEAQTEPVRERILDENPPVKSYFSFTGFVIKKFNSYLGLNSINTKNNNLLRTAEKVGKFAARLALSPTLAVAGFTGTVWHAGNLGTDFFRSRFSPSYPKDTWKKSRTSFALDLLSFVGSAVLITQLSYTLSPKKTEILFSSDKGLSSKIFSCILPKSRLLIFLRVVSVNLIVESIRRSHWSRA